MFNKVILIGNLTRDPEVRFLPSGTQATKISIAVNTRYKSDSELKEETLFIDVVTFGKQAEVCGEKLTKGSTVLVEGRLKEQRWESDGVLHKKMEVIANAVKFLKTKSNGESTSPSETEEISFSGSQKNNNYPDYEPF